MDGASGLILIQRSNHLETVVRGDKNHLFQLSADKATDLGSGLELLDFRDRLHNIDQFVS